VEVGSGDAWIGAVLPEDVIPDSVSPDDVSLEDGPLEEAPVGLLDDVLLVDDVLLADDEPDAALPDRVTIGAALMSKLEWRTPRRESLRCRASCACAVASLLWACLTARLAAVQWWGWPCRQACSLWILVASIRSATTRVLSAMTRGSAPVELRLAIWDEAGTLAEAAIAGMIEYAARQTRAGKARSTQRIRSWLGIEAHSLEAGLSAGDPWLCGPTSRWGCLCRDEDRARPLRLGGRPALFL
jgi:hypothetical protein